MWKCAAHPHLNISWRDLTFTILYNIYILYYNISLRQEGCKMNLRNQGWKGNAGRMWVSNAVLM